MINILEIQKELLLKERRVSFWERHHRLMPNRNEFSPCLIPDDCTAEFQDN